MNELANQLRALWARLATDGIDAPELLEAANELERMHEQLKAEAIKHG